MVTVEVVPANCDGWLTVAPARGEIDVRPDRPNDEAKIRMDRCVLKYLGSQGLMTETGYPLDLSHWTAEAGKRSWEDELFRCHRGPHVFLSMPPPLRNV